VNEIIHGRRGITPEAALSLADVLKTTPDFMAEFTAEL